MAEQAESEAVKAATPKPRAAKASTPKVRMTFTADHAGPTRRDGQHRYIGKDADGNTVQLYMVTGRPPKQVTVTVS